MSNNLNRSCHDFSRGVTAAVVRGVCICMFFILASTGTCVGENWEVSDFLAKISYERQEIKNGAFMVEWDLKKTIREIDVGGSYSETVTSVSYMGQCEFDHQTKKSIFRYKMNEDEDWEIGDGILDTEYVSLSTREYFGIYDPSRPNDAFFMYSKYQSSSTNGPWFSSPDPRAVGICSITDLFRGVDLFDAVGGVILSEEKGFKKPYILSEYSKKIIESNQFYRDGRTRKVLTVDVGRDWLPVMLKVETGEPFEDISDFDPKWISYSHDVTYGVCDGVTVPIECSARKQNWDYPTNPEAPPDSHDQEIVDMVVKFRWERCNVAGLSSDFDYKDIGLPAGCDIVDCRGESPNVIDRITRTGAAAIAPSPRKNVNSWVLGGFVVFVGLVFVGLLFAFIIRKKSQA